MIQRVMCVCTGNICRSPMAEVLLRHACPGVQVISSGTHALEGALADPLAREVLGEIGLDLSGHRGQQITRPLSRQSDLILVLDAGHKSWVEESFPEVRGRVFLLGHFGRFEVPDPYRLGRSAFDQALKLIQQGVADWTLRIGKA